MSDRLIYAYAIFVENEFAGIFYYPANDNEKNTMITAALQSNPKIVLDEDQELSHLYKYSVFVDDEYVEKIYLLKQVDGYDVLKINAALQNDPTLVWIESETLPRSSTKYSYENNTLTVIEE